MKFAVLPVAVSDNPRETTLTRGWIERACASVSSFIHDQSGGQQTAEFTVFDWYTLSQTHQQWLDLGFNVREPVNQQVVNDRQVDLSGYQHFVYVIDDGFSSSGVTKRDLLTSIIAARDFDPAILAHEVTHVFGPDDTFLDTPTGPQRYDALFCIMGREGAKHSFRNRTLLSPSEGADVGHTDCGPGMCVPTLLATGWLKLEEHGIQVTGVPGETPGGAVSIRALDGAPAAEGGLPVCCYVDDGDRYVVEYRIPTSRWDSGLPASPLGWLVVNRTPLDAPLMTLEVASFPVVPGKTVSFGGPDNIYLFGAGPLRLAVLSCDVIAGTVDVQFSRKKGKIPQYIEPFRGFRQELRYVLWSPESGWHAFPVDTDLAVVLKSVEAVSQIRDLARINNRRYSADLSAAMEHELKALQVATRAVGLRTGTVRENLVDRLGQLREKVGTNRELSELADELERLQSLAREIN